jgi:hypothetical protein
MRKVDASTLFAASKGSFGAGSWAPDDGLVFPDAKRRPYDYYKAGELNTHEMMIGGNSMDALGAYELPADQTLSMADYKQWMSGTWGNNTEVVEGQYPVAGRFFGNTNAAYIQASGDCGKPAINALSYLLMQDATPSQSRCWLHYTAHTELS